MQLHNKDKLSYYSALTVLFSYAEFMLPHLPFLKLGLGNIIVLLSLNFIPADFILLLILKSIASSFLSGTLFSPFFLISFMQSLCSGFAMYFLYIVNQKCFKNKLFSLYGISISGAGISAIIQVLCASLYLGKGVYNVLGIMMLFSIAAGIITAFLSQKINIGEKVPELLIEEENNDKINKKAVFLSTFLIILIILIPFFIQNITVLALCFAVSIVFQLLNHRKFLIAPHVFLWLLIIVFSVFGGGGEIFFRLGKISIYKDSFIGAIKKCLILSTVICVSQCTVQINFSSKGTISRISNYFYALLNSFYSSKGGLITRIKTVLSLQELECTPAKKRGTKSPLKLYILHFIIMTVLLCADFYLRKII